MGFMDLFYQCFFIPKPSLTEKNLSDQGGRVFIVTGAYAGVGLELASTLYSRNGTVYVAGRSKDKGNAAIESIKSKYPESKGRLEFHHVDLADLATIKRSAQEFMKKEDRLDVLTNNAGVMVPPAGSKSAQGYELQMATNCLGPYLFTTSLLPLLQKTAASSPPGTVRVTWAGSLGVDVYSPFRGGLDFDDATAHPKTHRLQETNYGQSKVGNVFLATEFSRRYARSGIISNAWNPGNLKSELQRHSNWLKVVGTSWLLYPPVLGAYTELWAGWSEEAGRQENNGRYIVPWGRFGSFRDDIVRSLRSERDGGNGKAERFWEWCEKESKEFA
ncbi:short-chain alcohol dehydrogenase [Elasticomyces elasticus]|nr:short-chain alcohol dehydrogenase [Elasticomyces elasticus]KAK5000791.1 short-chain alcohol dehydrogenase [Elasticomyces elasticus]KAK5010695.1 hypothetical protein LTR28_008337 [Elasticomyces elasticus]